MSHNGSIGNWLGGPYIYITASLNDRGCSDTDGGFPLYIAHQAPPIESRWKRLRKGLRVVGMDIAAGKALFCPIGDTTGIEKSYPLDRYQIGGRIFQTSGYNANVVYSAESAVLISDLTAFDD